MDRPVIKPRLKNSHPVYRSSNGDLAIGEVGPSAYFVPDAPSGFVGLIQMLDGTRTTQRLERDMEVTHNIPRAETRQVLQQLSEANLLVDEAERSDLLSNAEIERYDRQMIQFEALEESGQPGFSYQEKLKRTRACILGMGGWGTWNSLLLGLVGIGSVRLVDADYVEHSNLNRQVLYHNDSIGRQKVAAAADELKRVNPHVNVETMDEFIEIDEEQIRRAVTDCQLVVLCWANQSAFVKETAEVLIHQVCAELGIPLIELAGDPFDVGVGPLYDYSQETHLDLGKIQERERATWWGGDNPMLTTFRKESVHARPIRSVNAWQSAPSLSIVAGMAANEIMRLITGYAPTKLTTGKIQMSLADYQTEFVDYSDCLVSSNSGIADPQ